jgi:starch-binding outer membrane protein, SusD/RagB family
MKKVVLFSIITLVLGSSCKKFLKEDPQGKLLTDGFFKGSKDLDLAVTALYNRLNQIGQSDHEWFVPMFGGDDLTSRPGQPELSGDLFNISDASGDVTPNWMHIYGMISAANFIINGYEKATEATQEQRDRAVGQAYFIRAFAYFNGTRFFGCIPIVTSNTADLTIKKSIPAEVYSLVVSDLQKAETLLPDRWSNAIDVLQKPTAGTAKGLLASVYLSRAGWPVKGGAADYALAAAKAKEVIENSSDGGGNGKYSYKLLPNFRDLWVDKASNDELMFGTFYNNAVGNETYRAPKFSTPREEKGFAVYFAEISFFNKFPAGPRKDATFQTFARVSSDNGVTVDTVWWPNFVYNHPFYRKMRAANGVGDGSPTPTELTPWNYPFSHSSRTSQIMRFAEVKLIFAEAQAMATGAPNSDAYKQVNDVRRRAGLGDLTSGLSGMAFRDSVVAERGWEFAGTEFASRWFDLVRLEMVESANRDRHVSERPLVNIPSKTFYFAPIPNTEVSINPNLGKTVQPVNPL